MHSGNLQIVDPAVVPKNPIKPRVKLNIAIGGVLGLLSGWVSHSYWVCGQHHQDQRKMEQYWSCLSLVRFQNLNLKREKMVAQDLTRM